MGGNNFSFAMLLASIVLASTPSVAQSFPDETIPEQIQGQADEDLVDPPVKPLDLFAGFSYQLDGTIRQLHAVVRGREAYQREAPWQAQIMATTKAAEYPPAVLRQYPLWELNHICGGALIYGRWILTAAHCLRNSRFDPKGVRIKLGTNDISTGEGLVYSVDRVVIHADYNKATQLNDIALMRLENAPRFGDDQTDLVASIPLHGTLGIGPRLEPWQEMSVTGWGVTSTGLDPRASARLKKLYLKKTPNNLCAQTLRGGTAIIDNSVICAASDDGDTCQGDSGGPLVVEKWDSDGKRTAVLVGLVSWGRGCDIKGNPGVYTRITTHLNWIRRAMALPAEVTRLR
jgi:secreted trypsin-like serine protease